MDFFEIDTPFPYPHGQEDYFVGLLEFFRRALKDATPEAQFGLGEDPSEEDRRLAYQRYKMALPIVTCSFPDVAPCTLSAVFVARSSFTSGLGRFTADIINRWMIPGRHVDVHFLCGINFHFVNDPERYTYFGNNVSIQIRDQQELEIAKTNFAKLASEMRLIIKTVVHARKLMATESMPLNQKQAFIEDYITTLINRPLKEFDQTIFDQVHQVSIRASAEYNVAKIKENFARLSHRLPYLVDRDIYSEIQHFVLLFRDKFMSIRSQYHLYRIIAYKYLFRKGIIHNALNRPNERHMPFKLISTKIGSKNGQKPVLGLLVGHNVLFENEVFEARHMVQAVRTFVPNVKAVEDSYIVDTRKGVDVCTHYLELEKEDGAPFSLADIRLLRQKLTKELPTRVEMISHPLFIHRNEEEVMRNILTLSRQLKFVRDLPQVIINFDKQTSNELCFTVILLRLIKPDTLPFKKILEQSPTKPKIYDYDVKLVGMLRKKYPKEANVFEIQLPKRDYFRRDYSIDLYVARQAVKNQLRTWFGDFRDFNGGMISKQSEALTDLKEALADTEYKNEFHVENFFYSITPTYMQSVIQTDHLKKLFCEMMHVCEKSFADQPHHLSCSIHEDLCVVAIGGRHSGYQDRVLSAVSALQIPGSELCSSAIPIFDISALGFIFRPTNTTSADVLAEIISVSLCSWGEGALV